MTEATADHAQIATQSTEDDVLKAIEDFGKGVPHEFGPSSTYDLVYDGPR